MKKTISLVMVLLLLCSTLCGCGENDEEIANQINTAISKFDYINAQKLLDENKELKDYDLLSEQVKYESLMLECCKTLQLHLRDPNSLLIRRVLFYKYLFYKSLYNGYSLKQGDYPYVIITYTAKNGFGGYDESECVSFGPNSYDKYEENMNISDLSNTPIYTISDLDRFNDMFSEGKTPKINIEQYTLRSDDNE